MKTDLVIDLEPVRRCQWIDRNGTIVAPFWEHYEGDLYGVKIDNSEYCPYCGAKFDNSNYCPSCGEKMDEERTEE